MSQSWGSLNPVLVYNKETGAFVLTSRVDGVGAISTGGSVICMTGGETIKSSDTPIVLLKRLYDMDFED